MIKIITDLLFLCNNFCDLDIDYIESKYNINTDNFETYFNKNYKNKLIFNSTNSEILFIYICNSNKTYIFKKYKKSIQEILNNLFIKNKIYYFNKCHKNYNNNNYTKMHITECNCSIKVKSIVNLKISIFLKILKNCNNFNLNFYNSKINNIDSPINNLNNNNISI